ncbi:MAG: hypothetical protein PF961_12920 [Planctomycetota bacterium]|jgi:hypothetical protein|nr:hypothetical protein [Planctomycetota bacterium]
MKLMLPVMCLLLCACSSSERSSAPAQPEATPATSHAAPPSADFKNLQVRQSKLLPQLTAPGQLSASTKATLRIEADAIISAFHSIEADPAASPSDISRARNERKNLEAMSALYLAE